MARYRSGPRNVLLHASIVALAAATTSLWLARTQGGYAGHALPGVDGLASVRSRLHIAGPARPSRPVGSRRPVEAPPSLAIDAPAVVAIPAAADAPTIVGAPAPVVATAISTAYLRTEPSNAAILSRSLPPGTQVSVLGCRADCSWLFVETPDGYQAWSAAVWYSTLGSVAGLPAR